MTEVETRAALRLTLGAPIEELGDGLLLRHAGPEDSEALATFNAMVHRESDEDPPDEAIAIWTRDLLLHPHPTVEPALFTVVEDLANGAIVSSLNLIPQTWSYDDIPFGVGRIELVGTAREYRRRGLVRRQIEEVHRWSAAMGHLMQGITGIPWYYRQFGYEMCVDLGGGRRVPVDEIPVLKDGEMESFAYRAATVEDIPFLLNVDAHGQSRSLISCLRNESLWRYEIEGRSEHGLEQRSLTIIESTAGPPVGFVASAAKLWGQTFPITALELVAGMSWLAVMPSLLRWAHQQGRGQSVKEKQIASILLRLGPEHPAYLALAHRSVFTDEPYAWFIRVPDLSAFLWRIRTTLEHRLAASPAASHTGDLNLNFYGSGLQLRFEEGQLKEIVPRMDHDRRSGASFPGLSFLHVLTGWRSFNELSHIFPDCHAKDGTRTLVESLFPKRSSFIWPVA
jgi:hypothetical protein